MKLSRTLFTALILFLAAAGLLWAADPWKEKPYTEWTQKDVEKVAQDSPWARVVDVVGGAAAGEPAIARSEVSGTRPMSDAPTAPPAQATYLIQWASALTLRQARVRGAQLAGRENPQESDALLAVTPPYHILTIAGPNLAAFEQGKEEGTKAATYLELKPSKKRLSPEAVQFFRQGERLAQVIVFFPREVEGAPLIPASENKAEFHCRAGKSEIKASFDLRKMVRDGQPDL